jgi:hypothetical protein
VRTLILLALVACSRELPVATVHGRWIRLSADALSIDGEPVADTRVEALAAALTRAPEKPLIFEVNEDATFQSVGQLAFAASLAGYDQITFVFTMESVSVARTITIAGRQNAKLGSGVLLRRDTPWKDAAPKVLDAAKNGPVRFFTYNNQS